MELSQITPLVLTYNESENIGACLRALDWAREIVVVDSFSSDDTVEQAKQFANVRVVQRVFDTHAAQWNFGLQAAGITTPWVMALDADYRPTRALVDEIRSLDPPAAVSAYFVPFTYCVFGRPLRGTVYGPVASLFRRDSAAYVQDGHTQRLRLARGDFATLDARMLHDDRKPLRRWLASQARYMELEVRMLQELPLTELTWADRLRKSIVLAPWLMFFYCLIGKGTLFDGWPGWYYAFQRLTAELILCLELISLRFRLAEPQCDSPRPSPGK